jgi:hypothetical protein
METWQKSEMGDGVAVLAPSNELILKVMAYVETVHGTLPPGFGVFSYYDLEKNIVSWYFSPTASFLAKEYDAELCEKPTPERGFSLLAGDQAGALAHFPEYFGRNGRR